MNEILQTLNAMDGERLFWYAVFTLIALEMIVGGIVKIYRSHLKNKRELEKF